jgi:hypothetical protein
MTNENNTLGFLSRSSIFSPLILLLDLSLEVKTRQPIRRRVVEVVSKHTSSSGVKSLTMLKSLRISSGDLPLIMFATVLQPTSLRIGASAPRTSLNISTTNNWLRHKCKCGKRSRASLEVYRPQSGDKLKLTREA